MAYVMITSIFSSPSTLWITTSTLASWSCGVLLYVKFILKTGNQMFGLAGAHNGQLGLQIFNIHREPFGLVFSVHSMQTSWGVLILKSSCIALLQGVPKNVLIEQNHNQNLVRFFGTPCLLLYEQIRVVHMLVQAVVKVESPRYESLGSAITPSPSHYGTHRRHYSCSKTCVFKNGRLKSDTSLT